MTSEDATIEIQVEQTESLDMPVITSQEAWLSLNAHNDWDAVERFSRIQEQLTAFQQIALKVGSESSLTSILALICEKTTQLMRAERTTIFRLEGESLISVMAEQSEEIRLRMGQGIAGTVAQKRKTLNLVDAYQSRLFDPTFDERSGFKTHSCLTMPIFNPSQALLGVVQVINKKSGRFTLSDEEMLESICSQIGVSLTQHQFYQTLWNRNAELRSAREKLEHKNNELDMLYALERDVAVSADLETLIAHLLMRCRKAFRVEFSAILLFYDGRNVLSMQAMSDGIEKRYPERLPTFLSTVVRRGECAMLSIREIATLPEQTERAFGFLLNTLLIAPLHHEDNALGALILGSQRPLSSLFSPYEAKLASLFSAHIAPALSTHMDRAMVEKQQRLSAIGQMLSSLLHDMKTPLANIQGYTEFMATQSDAEKRASYAEVILRQVENLRNMSAEILQFARGESSAVFRRGRLGKVISEAVEQLTPEATRRHIRIEIDDAFGGTLMFDEVKILRVAINLMNNAMEAIDDNGVIWVRTRSDASHVYLVIEDNGPGIPAAIADTMFEVFVTSGKKGGTGLGLSIVKKIVDEHEAQISWSNVAPHGTLFTIAFKR